MLGYLVRRILWTVVLFVALTLVTYIIFFVIPSDAVRTYQGRAAATIDLRRAADLNGPVYQQYAEFLWRLLTHGSLGHSFFSDRSVNSTIGAAAPVTLSLVLGGIAVWMLIAVPVGIVSALRPRSLVDRATVVFVLVGISAHPVWIGLILSYAFGFKLHLLPLTGYCDVINPSTQCGGPVQWFTHLILPWLTFAMLFAALYARMIRASVLEALSEEYVRTARAKGAPEWMVLRSHVLRNAMLPVVTMLGMDMGLALGGAIFVETVFGLPGLGKVAIGALGRHDLPIIEGVVVFVTIAILIINLIVDLVYAFLDPRITLADARAAS